MCSCGTIYFAVQGSFERMKLDVRMTTAQSDVASDGLKTTAWEAKSDEVKPYFSVGVSLKFHKNRKENCAAGSD